MHPRLARILSAALLSLTLSLGLAYIHPFGNADLFAAPRSQPPELPASIPSEARNLLASSCADCHSSTPPAPLYGHFAPISWLLERDIVQARSHLNLSNWDSYSPGRQQVLLAEIAQQARSGHMPPPQYLLVHRHARLTLADIAALTTWTNTTSLAIDLAANDPSPGDPFMEHSGMSGKERSKMPSSRAEPRSGAVEGPPHLSSSPPGTPLEPRTSPLEPSSATQADATRGAALFNRRCTGCHSLTQNGEGPRLGGVYGRVAATAPGFSYSAALAAAQLIWSDQTLDRWLTDPDAFVPGNNMDFRVPRPQERADLIAFLKASSGR